VKQNKLSYLLLIAALLAQCTLPSCGEASVSESTDTGTTAAAKTDVLTGSGLAARDWGGKTFTVLTSKPSNASFQNFEVYAETENGDILNDAVYNRNRTLEELLNVTITEIVDPSETTNPNIRQTVLSDEKLYDLAFARSYEMGAMALDGMLYDMNQLEYADYTQDWWDQLIIDNVELNDRLFFASSDFNLHAKKRTYMLLYNTDMADQYHIGNLADVVRAGKWTIDKQGELVKLVASDLNGDTAMGLEDQYGLIADDRKDLQYFLVAAGGMIAKKNTAGQIELSLNNDKTVQLIDLWLDMMSPSYSVIPTNFSSVTTNFYSDSYNIFWSGRALFLDGMLNEVESASSKADFGYKVLPLPKLDEQQAVHYTMTDNIGMLFCVPINVYDPSFTGYMLEALSYVSSSTTLPTYYEKCCKIKSVYDEDSAEMIDLAMSNQICDIGFIYDIGDLDSILNSSIPRAMQNNFASLYSSKEGAALEAIENIHNKMAEFD